MAATLGKITARVLVQVADGDPVEVGTIDVDLPIPIRGAEPGHKHTWSWGRLCVTCGVRDSHADEQVDYGGWEDH